MPDSTPTSTPRSRVYLALMALYAVASAMDCDISGERPTEDEYQAAMAEAKAALEAQA